MRFLLLLPVAALFAQSPQTVLRPSASPLVTFRFVFLTGSADDPADQPGLAALTAAMVGQGGSKAQTYSQITEALFPMASSISVQVDKEMTTFSASTHIDNLEEFYTIFRSMLLEPGWRAEDLKRLRDQQINALRTGIRGNNDEELGKEVLYNEIYAGHVYGHQNFGTAGALEKMTLEQLQRFYASRYTQANLIVGLAGGYKPEFLARIKKDFARLPKGKRTTVTRTAPAEVSGTQVAIVDKKSAGSMAISIGFPIRVKRGDPDFLPLLVAQSALGQHRNAGGRLYNRIREQRGLNYGDYAYIEYYPSGMFSMEPSPNLARPLQIFQVWIRPLEIPTAHFGLRLALHELDKFAADGITEEEFQKSRKFLSKYVNLLTKTKPAELGYAIDSLYYGIPDYPKYVAEGLAKLTLADVNAAIRKHLSSRNRRIVLVARNGAEWKQKLIAGADSPMKYNSAKPDALLAEDKIVEHKDLGLTADRVKVIPVETIFE